MNSHGLSALPEMYRKRIIVDEDTGCWVWTGVHTRKYGRAYYEGAFWLAHRVVFTLLSGEIPKGLEIDHLCRNGSCVNPDHLEPVTHQENMRRAAKTHCIRGHDLSDGRVYFREGKPYRVCLECRRAHRAARSARKYQGASL